MRRITLGRLVETLLRMAIQALLTLAENMGQNRSTSTSKPKKREIDERGFINVYLRLVILYAK